MAVSAAVSLGLAGGGVGFSVAESNRAKDANEALEQRQALTAVYPTLAEVPDINGFELDILCDMNASESFCGGETEAITLSKLAKKRNDHFEVKTGAKLNVTPTADFYKTAVNDILSGEFDYNLYAADAAASLSHLLSSGYLHDISQSEYIDLSKEWYDKTTTEALSIYGGQYLVSSAAADARRNMCVIAYNRDSVPSDMTPLAEIAMNGSFTTEKMLEYAHAVHKDDFYGASIGEEDVFPLVFGMGGTFVHTTADTIEVEPLSLVRLNLSAVAELVGDGSVRYGTRDFSKSQSLFSVKKMSEVSSLRQTVGNIGVLPLPKLDESDSYSGYIDLAGAVMTAIPAGVGNKEHVEYAFDSFVRLSHEYIAPFIRQRGTGGNTDDEKMLEIIAMGASSDLSSLFGYGEIDKLFADVVSGEENNLTLEYYNRKTLYEKAISIIEKRFAAK